MDVHAWWNFTTKCGPLVQLKRKIWIYFRSVLRRQHDSTKRPVPFSRGTRLTTSCGTNITRPKPQSHLVEKCTGPFSREKQYENTCNTYRGSWQNQCYRRCVTPESGHPSPAFFFSPEILKRLVATLHSSTMRNPHQRTGYDSEKNAWKCTPNVSKYIPTMPHWKGLA